LDFNRYPKNGVRSPQSNNNPASDLITGHKSKTCL
jgi:hypothetical protein